MSPDRWVTLREVYRSTLDARPGADRAEDRRSRGAGRAAWLSIDPKRRSGIIEGLSVFPSVFDLPDVAATFPRRGRQGSKSPADPPTSPCSPAAVARRLPPLDQVIDEGKVLALNMPAGVDRGWVTDLAETRHPPCTGGEAPHGKRQGVPLRSGTRSGTTPEMSGLDREHAGVSGYGASRVGRSAHVGQESQGTPGPRSRPPMRLSRRGGPSVPSSRRCRPTAFDSGRREPPRTTRPGPVPRVGGPPGRPCTLPWRRRVSHSVAL